MMITNVTLLTALCRIGVSESSDSVDNRDRHLEQFHGPWFFALMLSHVGRTIAEDKDDIPALSKTVC